MAYFEVPTALVLDNKISVRARFIYCYLAAMPDGHKFTLEQLSKDTKLKQKDITNCILELTLKKWVTESKVNDGEVHFYLENEISKKEG